MTREIGPRYAAIDLGAESGRVIVGTLAAERISLDEVHRFANAPVRTPDGLHWDALRLYAEILTGLRATARFGGADLLGVGVDSWAVDYGLFGAGGRLIGNPYSYRDARTDGVPDDVARIVSPTEQYERTGIAQLPFNTLYQLVAERRSGDRFLDMATSLLLIPDLLHYWLSGTACTEYTNASTTGALAVDRTWTTDVLDRLDVPSYVLIAPSEPGARLGPIRQEVQEETGLGPVPVVLPATHDTASAVAAVPFEPRQASGHVPTISAYISSGTWSLLGLELDHPVLTEEARLAGFTNEGGVGGTFRFLTNIMGFWLVQECRRIWAREGSEWDYADLYARAAEVQSPGIVLDVDAPQILHPADMPQEILRQLARTGQEPPDEPVALVRVILEGLALKYRVALARAERLAGVRVDTIHIVGGGARNTLLCQLTSDACERSVLAGPIEATALGNVLIQAIGTGVLHDVTEARALVRSSVEVQTYEPRGEVDWEGREEQLRRLIG